MVRTYFRVCILGLAGRKFPRIFSGNFRKFPGKFPDRFFNFSKPEILRKFWEILGNFGKFSKTLCSKNDVIYVREPEVELIFFQPSSTVRVKEYCPKYQTNQTNKYVGQLTNQANTILYILMQCTLDCSYSICPLGCMQTSLSDDMKIPWALLLYKSAFPKDVLHQKVVPCAYNKWSAVKLTLEFSSTRWNPH